MRCCALALMGLLAVSGLHAAERHRVVVGRLVLEGPVELAGEVDRLAEAGREIVPRLERDLGQRIRAPFVIYVLPARIRLDAELLRLDELAPPWASGYLIGQARVGAIRMTQVQRYPVDSAEEVLAHEITHMLLWDAGGADMPRWFGEGVATWEGRRRGLRDFAVETVALLSGRLPPLDQFDRELEASPARARRIYAASLDFVAWNARRHGSDLVPRVLDALEGRSFELAWLEATGESLRASERQWRRRMVIVHRWIPVLASSGSLWIAISMLALIAGAKRRRQAQTRYEQWDAEEREASWRRAASAGGFSSWEASGPLDAGARFTTESTEGRESGGGSSEPESESN